MEEKKYPIGGYAPGSYHCNCCKCGTFFLGDKRAVECEPCAVTAKEKFDALSPEEQAEVMKMNIEVVNEMFKDWEKKPDANLVIMGHGKPSLNQDRVIANQVAGMPLEEAIFQDGYSAGIEFEKNREWTGAVWVKVSDRLPGYETPVKWRDGKDHSHATDGKIALIHMAKPFLTGWEWYDEGTAAGREEDAVEFAEWIREAGIEPTFGNKWVDFNKPKDNRYTTEQLYQQFKQQKEK